MDAVRVPASACSTSQSTVIVRSPSFARSVTARSERPINRWISWVRPPGRPLFTSRGDRSFVEAGSIEYSPVTQPLPVPFSHRGASSRRKPRRAPASCPWRAARNRRPTPGTRAPTSRAGARRARVRRDVVTSRSPRPSLSAAMSTGPANASAASATEIRGIERRDDVREHQALRAGLGRVLARLPRADSGTGTWSSPPGTWPRTGTGPRRAPPRRRRRTGPCRPCRRARRRRRSIR